MHLHSRYSNLTSIPFTKIVAAQTPYRRLEAGYCLCRCSSNALDGPVVYLLQIALSMGREQIIQCLQQLFNSRLASAAAENQLNEKFMLCIVDRRRHGIAYTQPTIFPFASWRCSNSLPFFSKLCSFKHISQVLAFYISQLETMFTPESDLTVVLQYTRHFRLWCVSIFSPYSNTVYEWTLSKSDLRWDRQMHYFWGTALWSLAQSVHQNLCFAVAPVQKQEGLTTVASLLHLLLKR